LSDEITRQRNLLKQRSSTNTTHHQLARHTICENKHFYPTGQFGNLSSEWQECDYLKITPGAGHKQKLYKLPLNAMKNRGCLGGKKSQDVGTAQAFKTIENLRFISGIPRQEIYPSYNYSGPLYKKLRRRSKRSTEGIKLKGF